MFLALIAVLLVEPIPVTYATGYIPNVQFAPFYIAQLRGYYEENGIKLTLDYTIGSDVFKLVARDKIQFGSADPDAFLHAVAHKVPLVHIATLYQSYPVAIISKTPLRNANDLRDKRIGISGSYGSSYLGLKTILREMELDLSHVRVVTIGFTQVSALKQGRVDAIVGYLNHEPVHLLQGGVPTYTRMIGSENAIPGVGIMTSRKFLAENPEVVNRFLNATFRGVSDVVMDPEGCFRLIVQKYLPELSAPNRYKSELKVLLATLPFWRSEHTAQHGYGQCEPKKWENLSMQLSRDQGKNFPWRDSVSQEFMFKK